jgi:hypothetical protein
VLAGGSLPTGGDASRLRHQQRAGSQSGREGDYDVVANVDGFDDRRSDGQDRADISGPEPGEPSSSSDSPGDELVAVGGQEVGDDLDDLFGQHRHPRRRPLPDERFGGFAQSEELTLDVGTRSGPTRRRRDRRPISSP